MKVYFYHTQNIQYCLRRMAEGEFPSHFLYGACHLADNGVDVVYHRSPKHELSRLKTALYTAWRVLTCRERFDAIYATHYKGLELVVLLRALGLFRKPIVVWHHQPIVKSKSRLRELLGRFFYKGFDRLIFFSPKLVDDSLKAPKADPRKLVVGHWGADLAFYDKIKAELKAEQVSPSHHNTPSPSHPNDSQLSTLNSQLTPSHPLTILIGLQPKRDFMKGAMKIAAFVEEVARRHPGKVQIKYVEGVPYDEYMRLLAEADVLVDQLYSYTPSMNSLAAMARGTVVIGGGEEEYYEFIGCARLSTCAPMCPTRRISRR